MKVLQALICAAAVFVLATGAYADGRTVADRPLQVVDPLDVGAILDADPGASTGSAGGCTTVYRNFVDGQFFFGIGQLRTFYDDILLSTEDDLSVFRELVSYTEAAHRRTSEPPDSKLTTRLRSDVNGDATGGPVEGPDGVIAGTICVFPLVGPTAGNPALFPVCLLGGDSGINLDEGFWMGFTNSDSGGPFGFNLGWLIAGGPATIGSSEDVFAIENDDGTYTFTNFGGDPAANFNAATCCQVIPAVPTVSEWGLITIVLLVLTGGTIIIRKARPRTLSA